MDREEFRRGSLESWQAMAPGWERRRADVEAITAPVRDWLVRELAPQPGETILELAAGPGDTGFAVASQLGDDGLLITSDFSPAMLDVARRSSSFETWISGFSTRWSSISRTTRWTASSAGSALC